MLFQAENHVCYTIYDARSPTANPTAGKYAARYSTSLNPKLNNELLVFERWNYCAGAANAPAYHSVAQTNLNH